MVVAHGRTRRVVENLLGSSLEIDLGNQFWGFGFVFHEKVSKRREEKKLLSVLGVFIRGKVTVCCVPLRSAWWCVGRIENPPSTACTGAARTFWRRRRGRRCSSRSRTRRVRISFSSSSATAICATARASAAAAACRAAAAITVCGPRSWKIIS